ncbi:MAG: Rho termination factor N-terminal domain-containing protein [Thermodesulfobacteriota bacterium]|nr:Rho termination factor N-terminal domain-containing protein [Thermodesulfobacteriota bacterium]
MAEEKSLEKLTVKKLKEIALGMEEIQGVSAMKKDELVAAIKEAKGAPLKEDVKEVPLKEAKEVPLKKVRGKSDESIAGLKAKMKVLREKREDQREKKDKEGVLRLKRRISRLKKRTRKLAGSASSKL